MAKKDPQEVRRQLARIADDALTATGRKASRLLQKMAKLAGLNVKSGGKHDKVTDPSSGRIVTVIPRSPRAKPTIEAITRAIINSVSDPEESDED